MTHFANFAAFAAVAIGMALTPGPNMAYLVSRSICQGRAAGLVSLGGVVLGFIVYVLFAAFGITALIFAIPYAYAYDALRVAGAAYLAYLAWRALNRCLCRRAMQPRRQAPAAALRRRHNMLGSSAMD
jgi:threonine/homoserine/homoserine lactone efflux protein